MLLAVMLAIGGHPPALAAQDARSPGTISGAIVDDTGAAISGATVILSHDALARGLEAVSGEDGRFSFAQVPPGSFSLRLSAPGFASQTISGVLTAGEASNLPSIRLTLSADGVAIDVTPTRFELAERQIKEQEQQRILGVVPNFFVSYNPEAVPLTTSQKFELSWKSRLDPFQFASVALIAGVQYARDDFSGFGDGPEGYAKRYGAAYANVWTRSLMTQVLLPSLFRQDPRYFYKGTGTRTSRVVYAVSRAVVRKGDNGRSQPNYSGILGSLAAGGLSNLYYPAEDRRGLRLTLENAAISIGGAAAAYVAQEFLLKKATPASSKSSTRSHGETGTSDRGRSVLVPTP